MYQTIKPVSMFCSSFSPPSKGVCFPYSSFSSFPSPPANSRISFLFFTPHPSPDAAKAYCLNSAKLNETRVSHNLALCPPVPTRRKCDGPSTLLLSPPAAKAYILKPNAGCQGKGIVVTRRPLDIVDDMDETVVQVGPPTGPTFWIFRVRFVVPTPTPRKVDLRCKLVSPPRNRGVSLKGSWSPYLHCLVVFMLYLCSSTYTEKFQCQVSPYLQIDTQAICGFVFFLAAFFLLL